MFQVTTWSCSSHTQLSAFVNKMPPKGAHKPTMKSKKKKSEGATAKLIHISKPGSDDNLKIGDSVPVVKLDKIVISSTDT